jgi:hypothetical protein
MASSPYLQTIQVLKYFWVDQTLVAVEAEYFLCPKNEMCLESLKKELMQTLRPSKTIRNEIFYFDDLYFSLNPNRFDQRGKIFHPVTNDHILNYTVFNSVLAYYQALPPLYHHPIPHT